MRWLNYQHLFYFWNIVRLGGVTQAARALKLAQPTISAQIKSFEETIGEKVFQREGRNLKLTEVGKTVFGYAEQIFSAGQELLDVLDGKKEVEQSEFKIGVSDVVPKTIVYKLIEPALDKKERTTILCHEDHTDRLLAELAIGNFDLVISDRSVPGNIKIKAYSHIVGESAVSFLGTKEHKKKYTRNFPLSLNQAPLILPSQEASVRYELDQWFDYLSIKPREIGSFQDRALMKIAAKEGKGMIPIPAVIAREVCHDFNLEIVGTTNDIKERLYIISLEKRLKHPLIIKIFLRGQKTIF